MAAPHDTPDGTPADLLARLARSDPTRPRLTWYDDQAGPTQGERIELSGRVLATWAAKAANLLQEDLDAGPGTVVELDLPTHWRAAYWLFAVWSVGAEAVVGGSAGGHRPDIVVTDDPADWSGTEAVVAVSAPALARAWAGAPLADGVVDEAKELASYGDGFTAWATPERSAVALRTPSRTLTYAEVLTSARGAATGLGDQARVMTSAGPELVVECWLPSWVVDGSLVLVRPDEDAGDDAALARRTSAERVTDRW